MKKFYSARAILAGFLFIASIANSQTPSQVTAGVCDGVIANFNTDDNGFNSPSVYGSIFDSSFYYHAGRGYWTDYLPPYRTQAPGFPRVMNIISPPYLNPNPNGTFNVGFHYIVPSPTDRFQVRIISVTVTPQGTVTNVEATSGVQFFSAWPPAPTPYVDGVTRPVPDPTPFMVGVEGDVCLRLIDPDIQNGPTTSFRVEVTYLINEPFFAVFDNLSIGPLPIPLPVDFIGLVAQRNNAKGVDLRWDVSAEVNVREYQVERSSTGSDFTTVGTIAAKGKSIYSFSNDNVPSTTLYYRIKSLDYDGKSKYSGILRLTGNNSFSNELRLYPVPATNEITAQHRRISGNAKLLVTGADGQIIRTIIPVPGASHTPINIAGLPSGVYFIRIDDGKGDIQSAKFIKN